MTRSGQPTGRAEEHRRKLLAHCYRMTGSARDAETLAEATLRRADEYDGSGSPDTWLLRTATAACLRALEGRSGRPLPTGLGGPSPSPEGDLDTRREVPWLEPIPDHWLGVEEETRPARVALEYVAELQHLPAAHRAAMLLIDDHGCAVPDVAAVVGLGESEVLTAVDAARARLAEAKAPVGAIPVASLGAEVLERWQAAFEAYDVDAITALLSEDAIWEMPPFAAWFKGRAAIGRLIRAACPAEAPGDQVLVPLRANGQPGFALYMRDPATSAHRAFQIQVLTLTAAGIVHAVAFFDLTLFDAFGLPQLLSDLSDAQPQPVHVGAAATPPQRED